MPIKARNSPATGLAMVASSAQPAGTAPRRPRTSASAAARPKTTPRRKVVRPDAA
ncbi:hypothetical protein AB0B78_19245 [Streptomyces sp. NPDC040724]|uniref:hypothetical protein n=1 Tax=Streptomyces sp. NPDC040724 TaxID=3155612 RepID=UPI0033E39973